MNIFIYGDESGVFDKAHQNYYVFGGLLFLGKGLRDEATREYLSLERKIKSTYPSTEELKAYILKNKHRSALYKITSKGIKYAFIIDLNSVNENIFEHPKSKQRYLDYVYKIGLKRLFQELLKSKIINSNDIENIYIRFDEHSTATDGKYELRESIEREFKIGTFNYEIQIFFSPILPDMKGQIEVTFKDSRSDALIRASDIIANFAFRCAKNSNIEKLHKTAYVAKFPYNY